VFRRRAGRQVDKNDPEKPFARANPPGCPVLQAQVSLSSFPTVRGEPSPTSPPLSWIDQTVDDVRMSRISMLIIRNGRSARPATCDRWLYCHHFSLSHINSPPWRERKREGGRAESLILHNTRIDGLLWIQPPNVHDTLLSFVQTIIWISSQINYWSHIFCMR
jgi:hypothetical protein